MIYSSKPVVAYFRGSRNKLGFASQEVAVKKFLDQDFSGDALVQFKSEVSF